MKPMLAATVEDLSTIRYPTYASPKLDGVRGLVIQSVLHSRSLKQIPNSFVSSRFSRPELSGLDGELILGDPTAKDVYRRTQSACSSPDGEPDVKFHVFDIHDSKLPYEKRLMDLVTRCHGMANVEVLHSEFIGSESHLLGLESEYLTQGYEGLILRSPDGMYKFGRSTVKQQGMMKLKRFTDGEFLLLDVEEEMENTNAAGTNELGRTHRSSAKAGLVGKGRAGTLCSRDLASGTEFRIGTGLDDKDKAWFWKHRKRLVRDGFVGKYKSFLVGVKDKPRFPVYLGPRDKWDL